jgi:transposase
MYQDDLAKLSKEELIALALAQEGQIEAIDPAHRRTRGEAGRPAQEPGQLVNTTLARAQAQPRRTPRGEKAQGSSWGVRALAPNPGRIIESVAERCPHCEHALTPADQSGFHAYDQIELIVAFYLHAVLTIPVLFV